ncbi:TolC family protein [Hydrogenimonas sp.]
MKPLVLILAVTATLAAQDYAAFEKEALENSAKMRATLLQKEVAKTRGALALRYDNPSLQGEVGDFNADEGGRDVGWRVGVSQPLRLPGVTDALQGYADTLAHAADARIADTKALYALALRRAYLRWLRDVRIAELAERNTHLAQRLAAVAKARFKEGGGTKARAMQARLEAQKAADAERLARLKARRSLTELAALAGRTTLPDLTPTPLYDLDRVPQIAQSAENTALALAKTEAKLRDAEAGRYDFALTDWRLGAEYEQEPDQSIARLGVEIELPLFAANEEERALARLEAEKMRLEAKNLQDAQSVRLKNLAALVRTLKAYRASLTRRIAEHKALLALFEEGYRLARSSLLELIAARRSLIASQKELVEARYLESLYRLEIDYLQGNLK